MPRFITSPTGNIFFKFFRQIFMVFQIQVLKKAWNNAPMTVQEDVMRTLDCCGYDHTEYMNKWVDDDTNVRERHLVVIF